MDLKAKVKLKSDQLSLQNANLQQHLCARVNTPEFSSFFISFVVAPFVVGAVMRIALGPKDSTAYRLYRAILPGLRTLPIFKVGI
jgi:hypothetical protein